MVMLFLVVTTLMGELVWLGFKGYTVNASGKEEHANQLFLADQPLLTNNHSTNADPLRY